jgi:hypothetical protein
MAVVVEFLQWLPPKNSVVPNSSGSRSKPEFATLKVAFTDCVRGRLLAAASLLRGQTILGDVRMIRATTMWGRCAPSHRRTWDTRNSGRERYRISSRGIIAFHSDAEATPSNTDVRFSRSDRNHQGKEHIQHSLDHCVLLSRCQIGVSLLS